MHSVTVAAGPFTQLYTRATAASRHQPTMPFWPIRPQPLEPSMFDTRQTPATVPRKSFHRRLLAAGLTLALTAVAARWWLRAI